MATLSSHKFNKNYTVGNVLNSHYRSPAFSFPSVKTKGDDNTSSWLLVYPLCNPFKVRKSHFLFIRHPQAFLHHHRSPLHPQARLDSVATSERESERSTGKTPEKATAAGCG